MIQENDSKTKKELTHFIEGCVRNIVNQANLQDLFYEQADEFLDYQLAREMITKANLGKIKNQYKKLLHKHAEFVKNRKAA